MIMRLQIFTLALCVSIEAVASVPWFTLYGHPEALNDPEIWKLNVEDLIRSYQGYQTIDSYQSESGSIHRALTEITNPEVMDIVWNFYKSNQDVELVSG